MSLKMQYIPLSFRQYFRFANYSPLARLALEVQSSPQYLLRRCLRIHDLLVHDLLETAVTPVSL